MFTISYTRHWEMVTVSYPVDINLWKISHVYYKKLLYGTVFQWYWLNWETVSQWHVLDTVTISQWCVLDTVTESHWLRRWWRKSWIWGWKWGLSRLGLFALWSRVFVTQYKVKKISCEIIPLMNFQNWNNIKDINRNGFNSKNNIVTKYRLDNKDTNNIN